MTARRMLVGAGAGSLSVPTGDVTVGAMSTLLDNSQYNAWPVLWGLANKTTLLGYTAASTHHEDNTGNAVVRILSGATRTTVGSAVTIYDHGSLWVSLYGLFQTRSGRIIASLWRDNFALATGAEAGIVWTDDQTGATGWSGWVGILTSLTQNSYAPAPAVQRDNGDLYLPIEGNYPGDGALHNSCHLVKSSNDGLAWGSESTVRDYATDTRPYFESQLIKISDTEYLILHRTAANSPGTHYAQRSTDGMATWGAPFAVFDGYGRPSAIRLTGARAGVILAVTRQNGTGDAIVYSSIAKGATWSAGVVVDSGAFEMEYGAFDELEDGNVLLVIGNQPTSSTSDSNLRATLLAVA